jgi:hypothetical protein
MCGFYGPTYQEIAITAAILPFLAYDVCIGAFNFYRWSRAKKLQSFKALGIAAASLCTLGGFAFGAWPGMTGWKTEQDSQRAILMLQLGLALLFFYPALDFIFSKQKRWRSYAFKLPVALLGIWLCIISNQERNLPWFLLSGGASLWDSWIYESLLKGPSNLPY